MRGRKRVAALLLTLCLLLLSLLPLSACAERNREIDREEVLREGKKLVESSVLLEEVFYGEGIPYRKEETLAEGLYYPAVPTVKERYGFGTVEELSLLTYATYEADMASGILTTRLQPVKDGNLLVSAARYYQKYAEDKTTPECIMVYSEAEVLLKDKLSYRFDLLDVKEVKGQTIYLSLPVTVTRADGETQEQTVTVSMEEGADGYRLTSPTYARYKEKK